MIGAWTINVSGRLYGPFTSERMRSLASENRLAPHSLVAREGSTDWHEARDEPEFSDLFAARHPTMQLQAASSQAAPAPVQAAPAQAAAVSAPVVPVEITDGSRAHFAVFIDQKSRSAGNLEEAIASIGPYYRLLHNVWIISTDQTVNAVRNRLVQELGKADSLFVIDASRGKAAWFNFGPEADVRIRRVWQKAS
jgi:hypothetical protein